MIQLRLSKDRGYADHGWLKAKHSFSFADYYDPDHMGFRSLRVINEDRVAAGQGFPTHSHRDMEIVTYVLEGSLEHKDSMGNGSVIRPGEVQYMSAGSGVSHSEFNHSKQESVHLLQIWILPEKAGLSPRYDQKSFARDLKNRLRLIVSRDGADGSVAIRQDARIFAGRFESGHAETAKLAPKRYGWVQLARGKLDVNGHALSAGDAAMIAEESEVRFKSLASDTEFLYFDLA